MAIAATQTVIPKLDPAVYRLDPDRFRLWNDYIYDRFGATLERPVRRAIVTLGAWVTIYGVGLAIAATGGLAGRYLSATTFFLFSATIAFMMGRQRWLKYTIFNRITDARRSFIVSDAEFAKRIEVLGRRVTAARVLVPLFLLGVLAEAAVLALYDVVPSSSAGHAFASAITPGLQSDWTGSQHALVNVLLLGWYFTLILFNFVPLSYASLLLLPGFPKLVLSWPVVPVPAYIIARFRPLANFYLVAASCYAVAVLVLVLLYGGNPHPAFVGIIVVLMSFGLACVLTPLLTIARLVERARSQLADALSERYYNDVYPIAADAPHTVPLRASARDPEAYADLLNMQEVMTAANKTSAWVYRLDLLIAALASQGLPFLGFLLPVVKGLTGL